MLCLLFNHVTAKAQIHDELVLTEPVVLYDAASEDAKAVARLKEGDRPILLRRDDPDFYEVKVSIRGRPTILFIKKEDVGDSEIVRRGGKRFRDGQHFGFSFVPSVQTQRSRTIKTSSETSYDVSVLDGQSYSYRLVYDFALEDNFSGRLAFIYRYLELEGSATVRESVTGSTSKFRISYVLYGGEASIKIYPLPKPLFLSIGTEVATGQETKFKVTSGPNIPASSLPKAFFLTGLIGAGYDKSLSDKWTFVPEARFGFVVTTNPMIYIFDVLATVSRKI